MVGKDIIRSKIEFGYVKICTGGGSGICYMCYVRFIRVLCVTVYVQTTDNLDLRVSVLATWCWWGSAGLFELGGAVLLE